jgi:hypothetical protein
MLAQLRSWWRALTGQSRLAGEMASEMDSHMERYAADLMAAGVDPGEARRQARIEFGSTAAAAEECREAVGLRWPNEFSRDLRYAARVLRKSPTFTAAAVATLACASAPIRPSSAWWTPYSCARCPIRIRSGCSPSPGISKAKAPRPTRRIFGEALGKGCATTPPIWTQPCSATVRWASTCVGGPGRVRQAAARLGGLLSRAGHRAADRARVFGG